MNFYSIRVPTQFWFAQSFFTSFPLYSSSFDSPLQLHSFFHGNKLSVETILWNRTTKPHTELPQHLIFFRFNFCPSFDTPSTEPTNKNRLTLRALCKDCLIRRRRITARNLRDNSFVRFGFFFVDSSCLTPNFGFNSSTKPSCTRSFELQLPLTTNQHLLPPAALDSIELCSYLYRLAATAAATCCVIDSSETPVNAA